MKILNATGNTRARNGVRIGDFTSTISKFLRVSVQICLKVSCIVADWGKSTPWDHKTAVESPIMMADDRFQTQCDANANANENEWW